MGEFNSDMNAESSEAPNGRIKQESLGTGGRNFLRRKLEGIPKPDDSDSDEDDRGLDVVAMGDHDHHEEPDDLDDPFEESLFKDLTETDALVPAPAGSYPATTNMSAESLDALCNQIQFTNVKHYLNQFYKVQELRDDFLHRKLKELCEERVLLKSMNASESVQGSLSPEVPKVDPGPEATGETGIVLRKPSHRSSEEGTCDANQRYQQETCEASHAEFLELQKRTTTLYSERPMMILPSDEYGGASAMFNPEDGTDQYF